MTNSFSRFEPIIVGTVAVVGGTGAAVGGILGWPLVTAVAGGAAALASLYGAIAWQRCSRSMRRATDVARALGRGDFEVRDLAYASRGLSGELSEAINDMADHLDAFVREASAAMDAVRSNRYHRRILPAGMHGSLLRASRIINDATDTIQERVTAFEASTDDFAATISSIVDNLVEASVSMGQTSERLGSAANTTDARAGAVASSSHEASVSVERATSAAEALSLSARGIGAEVDKSSSVARLAVARAQETGKIVASLSEAADRIGTVVGLIDQVASQTNLLALNATIEAARAGEAGRGFAVVASEVKQLASETARATQEISQHIAQVQSATKAAVDSIVGIGGTIAEIDAITGAMRGSIEAQISATGDIVSNVGTAQEEARSVSGRIADISTISRETAELARGLLRTSTAVSDDGSRLSDTVRDFLARLRRGPLDRRQSSEPRLPVKLPVTVQGKALTAVDLSTTGTRITGDVGGFEVGGTVRLDFGSTIATDAIVRWQGDGSMGVEFVAARLSSATSAWIDGQLSIAAGRSRTAA
jgi:methyl-accepting chemotaxis protein